MSAAAAAILDGMPDPRDLHRLDSGGETAIFAGRVELFRFAEDDTAMRHIAAAGLRQLGFPGQDVAAVLGLTPNYVATLHQRALREGTAGLVRAAGRPPETSEASWQRAREWRAAGVRDAEIARRLGVNQSTVLRRLGRAHVQDPLPPAEPEPDDAAASPRRRDRRRAAEPGPGDAERSAAPGPPNRPGRGTAEPGRAGRRRSGPGTRGRCCCTRSARGPVPGTSCGTPRARTRSRARWRCCRRSACASRSARRPPSSSSTWPRPRPGRWPGCPGPAGPADAAPGAGRASPTAPTR